MTFRFAIPALMGLMPHLVGCAVAAGAAKPEGLRLYANYNTVSVYLPCEGDSVSTTVQYRRQGSRRWALAQPLVPIKSERLAGCVFGLEPGSAYHIRVTMREGSARKVFSGSVTTRSNLLPLPKGKVIHVCPTGSDSADGGKDAPLATITHAMDQAKPGDVVVLAPGIYRQSVRIAKSGTPGAPILLYGQDGATITGASVEYVKAGPGSFTHVCDDLYKAPLLDRTLYVAAEGKRLYYWKKLELLKAGKEKTHRGKIFEVKGGWAYDDEDRQLYIRMPDGSDPNRTSIEIAQFTEGVVLDNVRHVILEGLDVGYFGNFCVVLRDSSNCVVRSCRIHHARNGLAILGAGASENLVQDCEFEDTEVFSWPWHMCKAHDPEGCAILLKAGRGNVIRDNRLHGFFNGIAASMWGQLADERFNRDMDVHGNRVWDTGDDSFEPEGACVNQRYWNNEARDVLVGISLAPITVGPCYFIRNTIYNHHITGVKLSNDTSGPCMLYHNTFVTTVRKTDRYRDRKSVNGISNSGAYHNLTFRNNIIQGTIHAFYDWLEKPPRGLDMDYDCLFSTHPRNFFVIDQRTFAGLGELSAAKGLELRGMRANPRFVNLAKGDLRLKPFSPVIDKAVLLPNINNHFAGRAPDIGAHEFVPDKPGEPGK